MYVDYDLLVFLLTSWATCCWYWRLPLVVPLSGSLLSSYKKDTSWILVGHFLNPFQSDNENRLAWKPVLTKVVNDKNFLNGGWIKTKLIIDLIFTAYLQKGQL